MQFRKLIVLAVIAAPAVAYAQAKVSTADNMMFGMVSDTTVPDTTKPDTTKPDTTKPDTVVPAPSEFSLDTVVPDTTKPDTTKPDTTAPDTTPAPTPAPEGILG